MALSLKKSKQKINVEINESMSCSLELFRTLVGWGVLPLCRDSVNVFYSSR